MVERKKVVIIVEVACFFFRSDIDMPDPLLPDTALFRNGGGV